MVTTEKDHGKATIKSAHPQHTIFCIIVYSVIMVKSQGLTEHFENKIITYFRNEVGPGVLQLRASDEHYLARIPDNKDRIEIW